MTVASRGFLILWAVMLFTTVWLIAAMIGSFRDAWLLLRGHGEGRVPDAPSASWKAF